MKQYFEMKAKHPDAVLLFRVGDFYETFSEDAIQASEILGITLTKRNNGGNTGDTPMAGFPHHALDTYLPKLIRAGKRVAICDQLEDPKKKRAAIKGKKGLSEMDKMVKRGITELVTPGIAMSDNVLNYKENNFLAAVHFGKTACGLSLLDISTGEFLTGEGSYDYVEKLLGNFSPKEVLYDRNRKKDFEQFFGTKFCVFEMDDWVFTEQNARQKLLKHFGTKSLKGFGVEHLKAGIIASGAIMQYLELTQHTSINHITSLKRLEEEKYVRLDKFTIRSLELLQPMQEDGLSLLDVIDRTTTPMGGRMLRRWMVFPLKEVSRINERLDIVEYFFKHPDFRQLIDEQLHRIGDLERIISKVAVGRVSPREVVQLKNALMAVQPIKGACQTADNDCLRRLGEQLNLCESLRDRMVLLNNMNNKKVANLNREAVNKRMYETNSAFDITTSLASTAVMGSSNETKDYVIERTSKTDTDMGNNLYFYFWKARDAYYACTIKSIELYFTAESEFQAEGVPGSRDEIISDGVNMVGTEFTTGKLDLGVIKPNTLDGSALRWDTGEHDVYYQGESSLTPPVTAEIRYELNKSCSRPWENSSSHMR